MLGLLRRRDFGLLWLGGLISVAGDWVLYAALPYFVYARTGSTVATAGMIAAELAPSVVVGTFAGVFVDRWNRKRVLVAGNLLEACAVALLLLVPHGWIGFVYVAALAQATVAAFVSPAESSLLPSLVEDEQLVAANALNAFNNRLGRLAGLPLGGALLAASGLRGVVLVDCATFVVAAAVIAPVAAPPVARAAGDAVAAWTRFWGEWLAGLRIVRHDRTIGTVFGVLGLMTFGGTMLDPLYAPWVRDVLGRGPEVYAWLTAAHAAAGTAGTVAVGRFGLHASPRMLMGWTSIVAGAALLVKWDLPSVPLALALSLLGGVTSVASSVGVETLVQRTVRGEFRGRLFGSLEASMAFVSLAGAAVGGALGDVVGIVPMLNVASLLVVLAGIVVLQAFARR